MTLDADAAIRRAALGHRLWAFGRSASFLFLGPVFTVALILVIVGVLSWTPVLILGGIGLALVAVQMVGGAVETRARMAISRETSLTLEEYVARS